MNKHTFLKNSTMLGYPQKKPCIKQGRFSNLGTLPEGKRLLQAS